MTSLQHTSFLHPVQTLSTEPHCSPGSFFDVVFVCSQFQKTHCHGVDISLNMEAGVSYMSLSFDTELHRSSLNDESSSVFFFHEMSESTDELFFRTVESTMPQVNTATVSVDAHMFTSSTHA